MIKKMKEVFIVYKNSGKWEIDEIFEEESDAIRYVDEYKEEFELIDNFIKYEKSLVTEEELINLQAWGNYSYVQVLYRGEEDNG